MSVIARSPEWVILEGVAYRRSDEHPSDPPWTHVERAGFVARDMDALRQELRGAVEERDALADAGRKVVLAFLAGTLTRRDIEPLVLALPDIGGQYEPRPVDVDVHSRPNRGARLEQGT